MANVPGLGRVQPNLHSISNDHAQIADVHQRLTRELLHLNNLPAVDQGNHVIQELTALRRTIENRFAAADQQFAGINHQLADISHQLTDINHRLGRINNMFNVKQVFNSTISRPDSGLRPIMKADGTLTANFPPDHAALSALSSAAANALLLFFGLPVAGTLAERKQRLRVFVGLAHMA